MNQNQLNDAPAPRSVDQQQACSHPLYDSEIRNGHRKETFEDRPRSWVISYEDGEDGCLPPGWYAEGLNENGWKITAPVYHEYGAFDTESEAQEHSRLVDASYFANNATSDSHADQQQ